MFKKNCPSYGNNHDFSRNLQCNRVLCRPIKLILATHPGVVHLAWIWRHNPRICATRILRNWFSRKKSVTFSWILWFVCLSCDYFLDYLNSPLCDLFFCCVTSLWFFIYHVHSYVASVLFPNILVFRHYKRPCLHLIILTLAIPILPYYTFQNFSLVFL